tara:strand:+ start:105 stop:248 length:144 start_codon:yes stop_codon:yes gene_type:complete
MVLDAVTMTEMTPAVNTNPFEPAKTQAKLFDSQYSSLVQGYKEDNNP